MPEGYHKGVILGANNGSELPIALHPREPSDWRNRLTAIGSFCPLRPLLGDGMTRFALVAAALLCASQIAPAADPPKDTPAAHFTRTKKLKGKVTVDFKNLELGEAFKEISGSLEDQKLGQLSIQYATGVSRNTRVTFAAKDMPLDEVLDGLLKQLDLGYYVVTKEKDRYDGWLMITKGTERGYPPGVTATKTAADPKKPDAKKPDDKKPDEAKKPDDKKPDDKKIAEEDEKMASGKLELAKQLLEDKKADRAKTVLKFIVKHYPDTKAGAAAKELLGKMDK